VRCRAIDANVILRFLLDEPPDQAERCQALFARLQAGEEQVYLPEVALSDVVWTLQSFYHWPRERIARFAHDVLSVAGIRMARQSMIRHALHIYVEHRIDFSDALIAAEMIEEDYTEIYSFDRDLDRVANVERVEP
jgi:predicted nucleic-acid-binding protein